MDKVDGGLLVFILLVLTFVVITFIEDILIMFSSITIGISLGMWLDRVIVKSLKKEHDRWTKEIKDITSRITELRE